MNEEEARIARAMLTELVAAERFFAQLTPEETAVINHYGEVDALADGYSLVFTETDEVEKAKWMEMVEDYASDMSETDVNEAQLIAQIKLFGGEYVPEVVQAIYDRYEQEASA